MYDTLPCGGAFGCGHPVQSHNEDGCTVIPNGRPCPCDFTRDCWPATASPTAGEQWDADDDA